MQKLFIDWSWGSKQAELGDVIVAECYASINPDVYGRVWNDRWLKEYATTLIKIQWGSNLKKFAGIQLPGGVSLNGNVIFDEAMDEKKRLEEDMEKNYGGPLEIFMN